MALVLLQVNGNSWTSPLIPLTALGITPGSCADTNFAALLEVDLIYVSAASALVGPLHLWRPLLASAPSHASRPGVCSQVVNGYGTTLSAPGVAGSEPGESLGCPNSDYFLWTPATISCSSCGGGAP